MLSIFICEDDKAQRKSLEYTVVQHVLDKELNMKLVLSTHNPLAILKYLEENPEVKGLYFLDVDLGHEMNGITLGAKIRELDDLGKIVFVTTHEELAYMAFKYKVEAMDYIIKDELGKVFRRVEECVEIAYQRHVNDRNPNKEIYTVKIKDRVLTYPYEEIMFIKASEIPHMLTLHLKNAQLEYYGRLIEVEKAIPSFYRCHKSVIANPKNIRDINKFMKEAEFINEEKCPVSRRHMKGLIEIVDIEVP